MVTVAEREVLLGLAEQVNGTEVVVTVPMVSQLSDEVALNVPPVTEFEMATGMEPEVAS